MMYFRPMVLQSLCLLNKIKYIYYLHRLLIKQHDLEKKKIVIPNGHLVMLKQLINHG